KVKLEGSFQLRGSSVPRYICASAVESALPDYRPASTPQFDVARSGQKLVKIERRDSVPRDCVRAFFPETIRNPHASRRRISLRRPWSDTCCSTTHCVSIHHS